MRIAAIVLAAFIGLLGITWIAQGNDFFLYSYFGPKYEQTRRDIFEQSKAHRQGMVQELQNMQFEYVKAKPAERDALASVILHRAADVDEKIMPSDLRQFLASLRAERAR
jgi:hypothetical protein